MATGLGLLGLSARDFWAMTPREYAATVRGRLGPLVSEASLRRPDLDALMRRFPDGMP